MSHSDKTEEETVQTSFISCLQQIQTSVRTPPTPHQKHEV